jgi:uncharacterized delta-60 repeat protein
MITVRGTSAVLSGRFLAGVTYAIRVFAMRADWDGVWHSTQNVTPHSQVVTFTVPGCALPDAGTSTTSTTTSTTTTTTTLPPVTLDTGFDPNVNNRVNSVAVQSDGKIIIGGIFTAVGVTPRNRVARLDSNGALDSGFDPDVNGGVNSVAVQSDGIIIGGNFTAVGSPATTRNRVARLNLDGTLDTGFLNANVNSGVNSVAVQSDGKILIGGFFNQVGSPAITRAFIARLDSNGTPDTGFLNANVDNVVNSVAVQSDGKIIIGGSFTTVGSPATTRNRVARLDSNGALDTGFNPDANSNVSQVAVQSDGKILIGGSFTTVGGETRSYVARLNSNGTLDTGFDANVNDVVRVMVVQSDGKIIIGGDFTTVGGEPSNRVARLNSNGTLDTGFDPNADGSVYSVAVQSGGKIIIGGNFTTVGGTARNRLARLS